MRFFETVFGEDWAPLQCLIWTLSGPRGKEKKVSHWATNAEQAADITAREAEEHHVYVGCCLRPADAPRRFGQGQRGKADAVALFPGTWLDIDMASPHRRGEKKLPPTQADCQAILDELGISPSIVIHSGFGMQAWFLLGQSLLLNTPEDLRRASVISEAFNLRAAKAARKLGWDLDSTHSLDHVLRVPGTTNWKGRWDV